MAQATTILETCITFFGTLTTSLPECYFFKIQRVSRATFWVLLRGASADKNFINFFVKVFGNRDSKDLLFVL